MLIANLGRETVAEGVEDAAQVSALQSLGCRYAQGYYFAKPQTRAQLGHALARANQFALQQPAA
jgi:EAL domain-containing protein (putative c-di-GMP-specific phosphodiesterase class I)